MAKWIRIRPVPGGNAYGGYINMDLVHRIQVVKPSSTSPTFLIRLSVEGGTADYPTDYADEAAATAALATLLKDSVGKNNLVD